MKFVLLNVRRYLMKIMFATFFCIAAVTITFMQFPRPRMGNTLSHVKDLHWVVVEDGQTIVPQVERLLQRTGLNYTYLNVKTADGYPKRGWYQRTIALRFIRAHAKEMLGDLTTGVVYFGDDDNSYDIRLFTEYIRNVKKLGMWAVGQVGGTAIESQNVINNSVVSYNVKWNPRRKFAVDMAGFAVSLDIVLKTTAVFGKGCPRGAGAPEPCLLEDMGLRKEDIEPFGYDKPSDREVYVWHTKSHQPKYDKARVDLNGFFAEVFYANTTKIGMEDSDGRKVSKTEATKIELEDSDESKVPRTEATKIELEDSDESRVPRTEATKIELEDSDESRVPKTKTFDSDPEHF